MDETFHDLVAERYERATTILASNLNFAEWSDAFLANKMLGATTLDPHHWSALLPKEEEPPMLKARQRIQSAYRHRR